MSKKLVVFLHGVGSQGSDLAGLGKMWQEQLPDVQFLSPNGPEPCDFGRGYQWFSVSGVTEQNRPARILSARQSFDAHLNELFAANDFNPQHDKLVLVGFSQGSIMALDALASGRINLAGVVAFSGRLASPEPLTPQSDSHVLIIHGLSDPVMTPVLAELAAKELSTLGVDVQTYFEPNLAHQVSADGAERALNFIKKQLS